MYKANLYNPWISVMGSPQQRCGLNPNKLEDQWIINPHPILIQLHLPRPCGFQLCSSTRSHLNAIKLDPKYHFPLYKKQNTKTTPLENKTAFAH